MTKDEAFKVIEAYNRLLVRTLEVAGDGSVYHYPTVDMSDNPRLDIIGDKALLSWRELDTYGGGCLMDEQIECPLDAVLLNDAEFEAYRIKQAHAKEAREAKIRAAQEAVKRDRAEAHDRSEWTRLQAKYGGVKKQSVAEKETEK